MKLLELTVLELIVEYQVRNRQVGHTSMMIRGAVPAYNPIIVVGNIRHKQMMVQQMNREYETVSRQKIESFFITVDQIKRGALKDIKGRPLVIDNLALYYIAVDVDEQRRKILMEKFNEAEKEGMKYAKK